MNIFFKKQTVWLNKGNWFSCVVFGGWCVSTNMTPANSQSRKRSVFFSFCSHFTAFWGFHYITLLNISSLNWQSLATFLANFSIFCINFSQLFLRICCNSIGNVAQGCDLGSIHFKYLRQYWWMVCFCFCFDIQNNNNKMTYKAEM